MSTGEVARPWPSGRKRRGESRSPQDVRRVLFGPVDHGSSLRYVREELERIREKDSERWNFDFEAGKPIEDAPVRYTWKACCSSEAEGMLGQDATRSGLEPSSSVAEVAEGGVAAAARVQPSQAAGHGRQTTLPEFMRKRKSTPSSDGCKSEVTSPSGSPQDSPAKVRRRAST